MELDFSAMRKDLLENGIVCIFGEIDAEMSDYVGKAILWLNRNATGGDTAGKGITLYISSSGGSAIAAMDIYDIIFSSILPVTGVVYRKAYSAAAIVFQACHTRVMMKNAEMMFHPTKCDVSLGNIDTDLEIMIRKAKVRQNAVNRIVAARMDRTVEDVWELIKSEWFLTAEEALERGLVDDIIDTTPNYLPYFKEQFHKREIKMIISPPEAA